MKIIKNLVLAFAAIIVLVGLIYISAIKIPRERADIPDPFLIESREEMREKILELTPVGSDAEDILAVCQNKGWDVFYNGGYRDPQRYLDSPQSLLNDRGYRTCYPDEEVVVGEKSMDAELGSYKESGEMFYTWVFVYWGFDADSKLVDIYVYKEINGL